MGNSDGDLTALKLANVFHNIKGYYDAQHNICNDDPKVVTLHQCTYCGKQIAGNGTEESINHHLPSCDYRLMVLTAMEFESRLHRLGILDTEKDDTGAEVIHTT